MNHIFQKMKTMLHSKPFDTSVYVALNEILYIFIPFTFPVSLKLDINKP